jgi:hypothetical protein
MEREREREREALGETCTTREKWRETFREDH